MRRTFWLVVVIYQLLGQDGVVPRPWRVVHERALWPDAAGVIALENDGLRFSANKKKDRDSKVLELRWDDIQQLTLAETAIEVVTYRDVLWLWGRDRQFRFRTGNDAGAESFAAAELPLRRHLGSRLVVALGPGKEATAPNWQVPAKRLGLWRGVEGILVFRAGEFAFQTSKQKESRRWLLSEIETIAQTSPYSLTVTVPERALADQGGFRSFSFQLKQPLDAAQYQQLWRAVERAHGTRLRYDSEPTNPDAINH